MLSQNQNSPVTYNREDRESLALAVENAKKGDETAFQFLYESYLTPLYRYIYSKTKDTVVTEDLCQTVFLKFWEALPRYELETSPLSYLFTIGKRLVINHYEKKSARAFEEGEEESLQSNDDILETTSNAHLAQRIWEYASELAPLEQDVLRLHYLSDLSHKEIAEVLDKEESYVRKIKSRALEALRTKTRHLYE